MKFYVSKKGAYPYLMTLVLYNICSIVILVLLSLWAKPSSEKHVAIFLFGVLFPLLNTTISFYMYMLCMSVICFKETRVECCYGKILRRSIPYEEVKEYGIVWMLGVKYLYVSRRELTKNQRERRMFDLYKKTRDVVVFTYQEEAFNLLIYHLPHVNCRL